MTAPSGKGPGEGSPKRSPAVAAGEGFPKHSPSVAAGEGIPNRSLAGPVAKKLEMLSGVLLTDFFPEEAGPGKGLRLAGRVALLFVVLGVMAFLAFLFIFGFLRRFFGTLLGGLPQWIFLLVSVGMTAILAWVGYRRQARLKRGLLDDRPGGNLSEEFSGPVGVAPGGEVGLIPLLLDLLGALGKLVWDVIHVRDTDDAAVTSRVRAAILAWAGDSSDGLSPEVRLVPSRTAPSWLFGHIRPLVGLVPGMMERFGIPLSERELKTEVRALMAGGLLHERARLDHQGREWRRIVPTETGSRLLTRFGLGKAPDKPGKTPLSPGDGSA